VLDAHVRDLAAWQPNAPRTTEIPFVVGRIVLNCAAGIPLLGDLTALRGAIQRLRPRARQRSSPGCPST
jgi:aconitate hydratase